MADESNRDSVCGEFRQRNLTTRKMANRSMFFIQILLSAQALRAIHLVPNEVSAMHVDVEHK